MNIEILTEILSKIQFAIIGKESESESESESQEDSV